ncbi:MULTISPECIES: rhomboid family intramembrane serine protease [unclassified Roseitalea]|uniref:rhomboid family intramembrane serine protease n=1 Tax=unclassified Roseitalea TaxID=2639107 RepID=UPI00273DE00A|nr:MULTISPECIES: rhomboid family intramembrane serine protease [unclassified Roseitalea]
MFVPLHDANRLKHIDLQYVTLAIIVANVTVYLLVNLGLPENALIATVVSLGYTPAVVNDFAELPPELVWIPEELSLISYSFLHGDFWHLGSNMLFLWVFGDNVEDAMGHVRFALFYALCAVAGALAHGLIDPASQAPLIGASGAVSGVIGAYLLLHPRVRVWILALGRIPLPLPAWIPLGFWIVLQFYMIAAMPEDQVSWAAHIGGLLAGLALIVVLRRRGVPLLDRQVQTPRAVEVDTRAPPGPPRHGPWGRG